MLVGTGFGATHLEWLTTCPNVHVDVLGYRHDRKRAQALAAEYGVPEVTANPVERLREGGLDAVSVVAPPAAHEPLVLAGLQEGILVVTDKPLALDVAGAERILAAADAPERSFVIFQWRANPALQALRTITQSGDLGNVRQVTLSFQHHFLAGRSTSWPWRHTSSEAGAGTLADQGVHLFDLLTWSVPGLWAVRDASLSTAWSTRNHAGGPVPAETEDIADVLLERQDEPAQARISVSRVAPGPPELRMTVHGDRGVAAVQANPIDGSGSLLTVTDTSPDGNATAFAATDMNPYPAILDQWQGKASDTGQEAADLLAGYAAQRFLSDALTAARI